MENTVQGGHGRVWHEVMPRLASLVDLRMPFTRRAPWGGRVVIPPVRRLSAWFISGHHGAWPSSVPVVSSIYEVGWHTPYLRALLSPEFVEMADEATRLAVADSDWIVVPASAGREQVVEAYGVAPERVVVVPLGVDLEHFNPSREGGRGLVAGAAGGAELPYVLFVGNLGRRKNLAAVREAMLEVARSGFPHRLAVVAGSSPDSSGDEAALLAELPGFPGRVVRFIAPSDDVLAVLMAGCDVMCSPSLAEGFGLPVLEALACGAPVVVSDRGSLPELVADAGVVVEPTGEGLAAALVALLGDPERRRQLASAARARAETMPWERTAQGWFEALRTAAGQGA